MATRKKKSLSPTTVDTVSRDITHLALSLESAYAKCGDAVATAMRTCAIKQKCLLPVKTVLRVNYAGTPTLLQVVSHAKFSQERPHGLVFMRRFGEDDGDILWVKHQELRGAEIVNAGTLKTKENQ